MGAVERNPFVYIGIIRRNDAAFPQSGNIFLLMKAETAYLAQRPGFSSFIGAADRVTGIFDHSKTVLFGNSIDCIHIAALTVEMNRYDCFGFRSDSRFYLRRINIPGAFFNIHKVDLRAQRDRSRRRGNPGERCSDDPIPRLNADADHGKKKCRCSITDATCMTHTAVRGKFFFKSNTGTSAGRRIFTQHLQHGCFVIGSVFIAELNHQIMFDFRTCHFLVLS
ncbi:MAG: hypothetical protein BWY07_01933 [Candidatus Hydrogenedentes bacterium ADurb.Bin170]|nr:MAG: hypothetical protein BWY07_01933 [Candidatus Hydrogenedentes bacterium ADurb.Bin170]